MKPWISILACTACIACPAAVAGDTEPMPLNQALAIIKSHRFVDLTHDFAPGIPHWKGASDERVTTLYTVEKDGFHIDEFCHVGQWGTHVDPPAHFHAGLRLEQVPEAGGIVIVSFPKPRGGSGFPARVIAIVP